MGHERLGHGETPFTKQKGPPLTGAATPIAAMYRVTPPSASAGCRYLGPP
jgi:hypothetical protein